MEATSGASSLGLFLAVRGTVRIDLKRAIEVADGRNGGVRCVLLSDEPSGADKSAVVRELRLRGYEVVDAGASPSPDRDAPILHRHVAVFCAPAGQCAGVVWIRALSMASPRRHLVLAHGPMAKDGRALPVLPSALLVAKRLLARGQCDQAWRAIQPVVQDLAAEWSVDPAARIVTAQVHIGRGDVALAGSVLHAIAAEAMLAGCRVPDQFGEIAEQVAFWIGADETAAWPKNRFQTTDAMGWAALRSWRDGRNGDRTILRSLLARRATTGDTLAAYWTSILNVVGESASVTSNETSLCRWARDVRVSSRLRSLAATLAGRACLRRDDAEGADRAFALVRHVGPEAHVISAFKTKTRSPLAGVECLVNDRLSDSVSTLIHQIEEAPDEGAALATGCSWVQRQGHAPSVGIVSADGHRLVAACGWKAVDLSGEIASLVREAHDGEEIAGRIVVPIRYAGTMLGQVVVRGTPTDQSTLQDAARTLAAVCGSALRGRLDALALRDQDRECAPEILGNSPAITDVRVAIARAAATTFPVLIEGESGTGKELVARAVHRLSARRDRRLVAVNCAALTDELVEAELFGHVRGAFTGAVGTRSGLFEEASGGTIFLDEVSELSVRAQAKLLRVLQEREIRRVGENAARRIDVRTVAATNVPLTEAVSAGRFRDDLRFRLAVIRIRLPPLRARLEDLPLLTHVLWRRALAETGKRAVLGPDVMASLGRHSWPGNVRELQNVIAGLAVAAPARGRVTRRHVAQVISELGSADDVPPVPLDRARHLFERRLVAAALARHAGQRSAAAHELGLSRQGLAKALRRLGLSTEEDTAGVA